MNMPDVTIDTRLALRVFEIIRQHGYRVSGDNKNEYVWSGLTVDSGFDGYTVSLRNHQVSMTIFFHNKFSVDYPNKQALSDFIDTMQRIDRSHKMHY